MSTDKAGNPVRRVRRLGWELGVVVALLLIAVGLVTVVATNLQTSADIRKESQEAHILGEMQLQLTTIERALTVWALRPGEQRLSGNPALVAAVSSFKRTAMELAALIDGDEGAVVEDLMAAFDEYVSAVAEVAPDLDRDGLRQLTALGLEVRSPLLNLLHEESSHLVESVAADARSDVYLRWGAPLLVTLALLLTGVVIRLQRRARALHEEHRINAARQQFIASVSHELRTPLSPVVGLAHELRDRVGEFSPAEIEEFAASIAQGGDEVAAIVEDLLTEARIEAGRLEITPATLDIREQVEQALSTMSASEPVEIEAAGRVFADGRRLRQVLRNVMSNAVRYGGDRIRVTSHHGERDVKIVVADTGPGIPPELQEYVFEPYATAHDLPGVPASVGLGLTVSRLLADLMGGSLTYTHENGWSCLNLSLPAPAS